MAVRVFGLMNRIINVLRRAVLAAMRPYLRLSRGMTMGVRALVRDDQGRVLLIRHSYMPGWTLPGGGVDPGERLHEALIRELFEETGAAVSGEPRLHGIFANFQHFPRDHVAVYVVDDWTLANGFVRSLEIVDHGFFAVDALPDDTSTGARRRIAEVCSTTPISADW